MLRILDLHCDLLFLISHHFVVRETFVDMHESKDLSGDTEKNRHYNRSFSNMSTRYHERLSGSWVPRSFLVDAMFDLLATC